jgi:hypothetical protein
MWAMDGQTRRDVLKAAGVADAAALLSGGDARAESAAEIVAHRSTTGVFVPPRGASFIGPEGPGFSRFDPQTLSLPRRDGLLPTLIIVDDTFAAHRSEMTAVIRETRRRAGLG